MLLRKLSLAVAGTLSILAFSAGCGAPAEDAGPLPSDPTSMPDDESLQSEGDVGDEGIDIDGEVLDGDAPLIAADDSSPAVDIADVSLAEVSAAALLQATANLNLRKGPGTGYAVLKVIPKGATVARVAGPSKGWYEVRFNGTTGWSSGTYLKVLGGGGGGGDVNGPPSPANAVARAAKSVGFSYWWGGGAWSAAGASSSTRGSCSGSCPSCSHSGRYGADCSGMVAKAWQFGVKALETNSHPYSTVSFNRDAAGKWRTVSRGALKAGDALVYNTGGAGHVVLFEKGSGWGTPTVYECKGCSYGCVHDTRSFSSSYHGIRRAGF